MNVLLFGGTGRLSKDFVNLLVDSGVNVFCLTRGSEYRELFIHEKATMLYADVRDVIQCKKVLAGYCFDVVIDFISYTSQNIENKLKILDYNFSQYIFISSATVYTPSDSMHDEKTASISNINWNYSANKVECEKYLSALRGEFEKNNAYYTIVRPYVTYGNTRMPYPLEPLDGIYEYSLVKRLLQGEEVVVIRQDNKVTITHTRDFAQGLMGLLKNRNAVFEDFHITGDETCKWEDVIDICGNILKTDVKKVFFDLQEIITYLPEYRDLLLCDKANSWLFDNSKIKKAVSGFECKVDMEKGLAEMLEFYKKYGKEQRRDLNYENKIQELCRLR